MNSMRVIFLECSAYLLENYSLLPLEKYLLFLE